MLTLIFTLWVLLLKSTGAVFNDEAFHVDWQIENLGDIKCIDKSDSSFVVLGETPTGIPVISLLDAASGNIVERFVQDASVAAMKVVDGNIHLNTGQVLDSLTGFPKSTHSGQVECRKLDIQSVTLNNNTLRFNISSSEGDVVVKIPETFRKIEYFGLSSDSTVAEVLISTTNKEYYYTRYENHSLTAHWERNEGYSDIIAYTVLEETNHNLDFVRDELLHEQQLSLIDAYKFRVQSNWERLKSYLIRKRFNLGRMFADLITEDDSSALRDLNVRFGFAKQLVVASKSGIITSLDIISGKKLWSLQSNLKDILKLRLRSENELSIVTRSSIYSVNLLEQPLGLTPENKAPDGFQFDANSESPIIKLVNVKNSSFKIFNASHIGNTNISFVHFEEQKVTGYALQGDALLPTYQRNVGGNERIVGHAVRDKGHVPGLGAILGNRTVLYKYLNPNIGGYLMGNSVENSLLLEIFDTVTGQTLYTVKHEEFVDLTLPVNLVIGEHWCIYSYFSSAPIPEQKLVVVEFYESLVPDERRSLPGSLVNPLDDIVKPATISNAYYFPQIIHSLALSKTKFGITTKAILLQLDDGSITYLPKYVVNARRKPESDMTKKDKEEFMASVYEPTIPINDFSVVSHLRQILPSDKSKLISVPTNLESTSIICSIGNDIFCTRVSPSSQFDKLGASFEKSKVLFTIMGLFILCYILRPMVDQRKLKVKWLVKDLDITSI